MSDPIDVLLLEDDPDVAELLDQLLSSSRERNIKLHTAYQLSSGLELLRYILPDVVLLDLTLPDSGGMDTFLAVHRAAPAIPVVVLTALDNLELAVAAVQAGAQDYLIKGQIDVDLLVRSMAYAIERQRLFANVQRQMRALKASEERYRLLTEGASDAIVTINEQGAILFANPATERLFGYSPSELLDRDFATLVPGYESHQKLPFRQWAAGLPVDLPPQGVKVAGLHKSQRVISLELTFGEFFTREGRGFTGIIRDASQRTQAELIQQWHTNQLWQLAEASIAINGAQTLQDLLKVVTETALDVMGAQVAVTTLQPESLSGAPMWHVATSLTYRNHAGAEFLAAVEQIPLESTNLRAIYRFRQPSEPNGLDSTVNYRDQSILEREWLTVPLTNRVGELAGRLFLADKSAGTFSHDDEAILTQLAQTTSVAIENVRLFAQVQRAATTDALTGLNNRRQLFKLAEQEFERSKRYNRPLAAIMLDIDHFKGVNDRYGHAVGDEVLRVIARTCERQLRRVDVIGRYGGEEFAILLPETSLATARVLAERLRYIVEHTLVRTRDHVLSVTISLGVVAQSTSTGDIVALLDGADQGLYRAKRAGRNRVGVEPVQVSLPEGH